MRKRGLFEKVPTFLSARAIVSRLSLGLDRLWDAPLKDEADESDWGFASNPFLSSVLSSPDSRPAKGMGLLLKKPRRNRNRKTAD